MLEIKNSGRYILFGIAIFMQSCSTTDGPGKRIDVSRIPDAVPKAEPKSNGGNNESYVVLGKRYFVMPNSHGYNERGIASWYGEKFHGRRTSNGETYDMYAMTAAHKTLPLPSYVQVVNLSNGKSVVLRVNDRGPFHENRVIDLSYTAALKLDIVKTGTGLVEIRALSPGQKIPDVADSNGKKWNDESHLRNRIYIQVGAFATRLNAESLMTKLLQLQFKNVQVLQASDASVYRVRIGPLHAVATADTMASRLTSFGYNEFQVMID